MDGRELLKRYDAYQQEAQFLRDESRFLRGDRDHYRREWYFIQQRVNTLKERVEKREAENRCLRQQVRELTAGPSSAQDMPVPGWVKPSVVPRRCRKPGRRAGHPAALRPMPDQPPAANVPHGQLGINALATAVVLRVTHRLPFRQVARVFADLPGLSISPGTIARQVQRVAGWLGEDYDKLLLELRSSPRVHADETGWRTNGRNGYLWALTNPRHTLYHVDKTRSGKVIVKLLGKAFGLRRALSRAAAR
jgi:hypothetical protein